MGVNLNRYRNKGLVTVGMQVAVINVKPVVIILIIHAAQTPSRK